MKRLFLLLTPLLVCSAIHHISGENAPEQSVQVQAQSNPPAQEKNKPAGPAQNKPLEIHYSLKPDGREWKLADKNDNKELTILQYVPVNPKSGDINEALTIFYMKNFNSSPAEYFDIYLKQLKTLAPDSTISSKIIKKDNNSLFGEWWIADKSPKDLHEWVRIFSDGKQFAIIKFSTTKMDEIEKMRPIWEEILGSATYN